MLYGGPGKFGMNGKLLFQFNNLTENFYQVKISFGFFKIDSWNDEKALFFIDSVKIGNPEFKINIYNIIILNYINTSY